MHGQPVIKIQVLATLVNNL